MFIRNCLTKRSDLTVVHPEDRIGDVLQHMTGHLSLPCVDSEDKFLGLVSKRTIFESFQTAHDNNVSYDDFCNQSVAPCIDNTVATLTSEDSFEDTIDIIVRYPFVPIVENNKLVGIVKRGDVNQALAIAFATGVDSHRLVIGSIEVEGALHRLFTITHRLGIPVITAVPFDAGTNPLNRRLIVKVARTNKLQTLVDQLERGGFLVIEVKQ